MILALALALFALQATPSAPPVAAPPTPVSPVVVEAPPAAPDPEKIAADLALMYDQSCGGRLYGTYAQACNGLADQLARAQSEARRAAKLKARQGAATSR